MKKFIFIFVITLSINTLYSSHRGQLYECAFLKDYKNVRTFLLEEGFKRVAFKTPDGLTLKGLYLARPHATCTVIVCAGWIPGKSENMATFYDLLPDYCNILLFEARGRGESEGPLFSAIWRYGVDEYKDILGCISCVRHFNQLPIIFCGLCSGAFNAARAITILERENLIGKLNIKGLIFDSGWWSVATIARSTFHARFDQFLLYLYKKLMSNDANKIKNNLSYKCISHSVKSIYNAIHACILKPILQTYKEKTDLLPHINTISIPVLFIHSYDDTSADIHEAQKISAYVKNKECWWITEKSFHIRHHILHKDEYAKKINSFIKKVL